MVVQLTLRVKYINSLGYWSNFSLTDFLPGGCEVVTFRSLPQPMNSKGKEEEKEKGKEEEKEDLFDLLPDEV